jgi:hypothetical protein
MKKPNNDIHRFKFQLRRASLNSNVEQHAADGSQIRARTIARLAFVPD